MRILDESKLENILEYIKTYQIRNGKSPSYRNIQQKFSFKSLSTVSKYVQLLQNRGALEKGDNGEIEISSNLSCGDAIIAPIVGTVTCGRPILAQENIEGNYALPSAIFGKGDKFLLYAEGDSMEGVGIKSGDILVVNRCSVAENGQIVVALIDDSATVKTFYKKKDYIMLHPENPIYNDIIVKDVQILGIVEHFIHKL